MMTKLPEPQSHADREAMAAALSGLLQRDPSPDDEKVHALGEKMGAHPDKIEETAYAMLADAQREQPGKHRGKPARDFDQGELRTGMKVEREHTDNPAVAREIAKDHLAELGDYYTRLTEMEREAKREQVKKAELATPGNLADYLVKSQQLGLFSSGGSGTGVQRPGHKYIKREGAPGHYEYTYPEDEKPAVPAATEPEKLGATDEERAKTAREMGERAFAAGVGRAPALDAKLAEWTPNRQVGDPQTKRELSAWLSGWDAANLRAQPAEKPTQVEPEKKRRVIIRDERAGAPAKPATEPAKPAESEKPTPKAFADKFQTILDRFEAAPDLFQAQYARIADTVRRGIEDLRTGGYEKDPNKRGPGGWTLGELTQLTLQNAETLVHLMKNEGVAQPTAKPAEPKPEPMKPTEPEQPKLVIPAVLTPTETPAGAAQDLGKKVRKSKPKAAKAALDSMKVSPREIERTGDHIWGARRDLASRRITSSEDLKGLSFSDAAHLVNKKNLIPVHDLQTAKAMGMSPGTAYMSMALLASIKAKPEADKAIQEDYTDKVLHVYESVKNCKTLGDLANLLGEFRQAMYQEPKWVRISQDFYEERSVAVEAGKRFKQENPTAVYGLRFGYLDNQPGYYLERENTGGWRVLGKAFAAFLPGGYGASKARREAERQAYHADNWGTQKDPNFDGWAFLQGKQQAKAEKKAGKTRSTATEESFGAIARRLEREAKESAAESTRQGGKQLPTDPNPKRVEKTFGLREVDFGEPGYMTQADRAYHVKALEGALHDFADVLQLPPESLSFKGKLGIAMGARGSGDAAAHYEPGRFAINITKFRGGGSLAHEWAHALDNIVALAHKGDQGRLTFLTHTPDHTTYSDDLRKALTDVHDAMHYVPDREKAKAEWKTAVQAFKGKYEGLVDKNNALVKEVEKLKDKIPADMVERRAQHLANKVKEYASRLPELQSAAEVDKKRVRSGFGTSKAEQAYTNTKYWMESAQRELDAINRGEKTRTAADDARIQAVVAEVEGMRADINQAKQNYKAMQKVDPEATRFSKTAALFDAGKAKKYWSEKHEMFARAFNGYIHAELKKHGQVNSYLTRNPVNDPTKFEGIGQLAVHPDGDEAERINAALGKLMDVVRSQNLLKKAQQYLDSLVKSSQRAASVLPMHGWLRKSGGNAEAIMAPRLQDWLIKADLTPEKAKKILHDGEVHGQPITEQQRKYFGAVASGSAYKAERGDTEVGKGIIQTPMALSRDDQDDDQDVLRKRAKSRNLRIGPPLHKCGLSKTLPGQEPPEKKEQLHNTSIKVSKEPSEQHVKIEGAGVSREITAPLKSLEPSGGLQKSGEEKPGHKYIRRTGAPGSYQYEYAVDKTAIVPGRSLYLHSAKQSFANATKNWTPTEHQAAAQHHRAVFDAAAEEGRYNPSAGNIAAQHANLYQRHNVAAQVKENPEGFAFVNRHEQDKYGSEKAKQLEGARRAAQQDADIAEEKVISLGNEVARQEREGKAKGYKMSMFSGPMTPEVKAHFSRLSGLTEKLHEAYRTLHAEKGKLEDLESYDPEGDPQIPAVLAKKSLVLSDWLKSQGGGHKYIKRTGGPGNWKYTYLVPGANTKGIEKIRKHLQEAEHHAGAADWTRMQMPEQSQPMAKYHDAMREGHEHFVEAHGHHAVGDHTAAIEHMHQAVNAFGRAKKVGGKFGPAGGALVDAEKQHGEAQAMHKQFKGDVAQEKPASATGESMGKTRSGKEIPVPSKDLVNAVDSRETEHLHSLRDRGHWKDYQKKKGDADTKLRDHMEQLGSDWTAEDHKDAAHEHRNAASKVTDIGEARTHHDLADWHERYADTLARGPYIKSMSGMVGLEDYMRKSDQSLPMGEAGFSAGVEVQKRQDGGQLEGVGHTGADTGHTSSETTIGDVPRQPEHMLSADDAAAAEAMQLHKKPLEESVTKSEIGYTQQEGMHGYNAMRQQALQKAERERFAAEHELHTGPIEPPAPAPDPIIKGRTWQQGNESVTVYSDQADRACFELLKSDDFYQDGGPVGALRKSQIDQVELCKACHTAKPAYLTACPHCGDSTTMSRSIPVEGGGEMLEKSETGGLRLREGEPDVYAPNGVMFDK